MFGGYRAIHRQHRKCHVLRTVGGLSGHPDCVPILLRLQSPRGAYLLRAVTYSASASSDCRGLLSGRDWMAFMALSLYATAIA